MNDSNYQQNYKHIIFLKQLTNISLLFILFTSIIIIIFSNPVNAYSINGYVINILNAPIQNARIDLNTSYVITDINGYYTFNDITDGNYSITARAVGYKNNTNTTTINNNTIINFTLKEKMSLTPQTPDFTLTSFIISILSLYILTYNKKKKIRRR